MAVEAQQVHKVTAFGGARKLFTNRSDVYNDDWPRIAHSRAWRRLKAERYSIPLISILEAFTKGRKDWKQERSISEHLHSRQDFFCGCLQSMKLVRVEVKKAIA